MKRQWLIVLFFLVFAPVATAVTFTNSDGSKLSAICIAAVESDEALARSIRQFGFTKRDLNAFTCNGLKVDEFAKKYRNTAEDEVVRVYAFEVTQDNRESQLCVAAATSNQKYKEVKRALFGSSSVSGIVCNGLPLDKFARRYGNKKFSRQ